MSPEREVFLAVCLFLCVYYGGVQAPACSSAGVPDMSNPASTHLCAAQLSFHTYFG